MENYTDSQTQSAAGSTTVSDREMAGQLDARHFPAQGDHDAGSHDREPPAEERAVTGEPRVDGALGTMANLAELPVSEHPLVFERIHGQLVEVLGDIRSGPDPAAPGR
jgi:hypothetical protein